MFEQTLLAFLSRLVRGLLSSLDRLRQRFFPRLIYTHTGSCMSPVHARSLDLFVFDYFGLRSSRNLKEIAFILYINL